jgi:hypothetical protein
MQKRDGHRHGKAKEHLKQKCRFDWHWCVISRRQGRRNDNKIQVKCGKTTEITQNY